MDHRDKPGDDELTGWGNRLILRTNSLAGGSRRRYQIRTRSAGGMYMPSPDFTPNAS